MINLLIADDEPLVQAGIKSMINWDSYDINIVGTATNGAAAWDMIQNNTPEIVITDIKMPVMSGLELARKCYEENRTLPVFIILTSYEEFQFVKEALNYQVIAYLVKLELTQESLGETLERAIARVSELRSVSQTGETCDHGFFLIKEHFFTRLVLNLFESEQQFLSQAQNLNISFDYAAYACSYVTIDDHRLSNMTSDKQITLYTNSLQVTREIISKYITCHVLSLDTKHFCILFFLSDTHKEDYRSVVGTALAQTSSMLFNYYNIRLFSTIGSVVTMPLQIASSYQDAKQIAAQLNNDTPVLFFEDFPGDEPLKNVFNMSLFKQDIRRAYAEFDEKALYDIFTNIIDLFKNQSAHYVQALDAAGNILYLSLSLLNNGEQIVSDIFSNRSNGYRSLYELTSVEQILDWLTVFRDGLCESFASHNKDYKHHIVINVKKYIQEHVREKLNLNKVAEVFSISPNYLSVLFSKYNDLGFTDYINQSKVEAAIHMMTEEDRRVYEISDLLGFESAFYFSRVFKKVTGVSPRDYMNNNV
ncbi:MAG: response regulator [Lachnospiraceae bacterium]|nr:response regulator [Lachnospiraceae bacterium]